MKRLLIVCTLAVSAYAAPLAQWQAGRPPVSDGMTLAVGPNADWTVERRGDVTVARIKPNLDYYSRAAFVLKLAKPVAEPAWLSIGYWDEGYGLIGVNVEGRRRRRGAPSGERRGVVRLDSGKLRHAVLQVEKLGTEVRIEGLTLLHSVEITREEPAREADPPVKPAFTLKNPPNLVTTANTDSPTVDGLPNALANMRVTLPLVKALGFNGIESYVKWNFVERSPGVFDWSYYDAVVDELERHGLKWFPLLIVGSAYSLPEWFHDSKEFTGFACLEHNIAVEIPTIFNENQTKYVRRFLSEFGKHYGSRPSLLGVRLGPSGNYGEAQYPASGNWGYRGRNLHTHLGYWAGDPDASVAFRAWVKSRYSGVKALNDAWGTEYAS
ncbi:MAG: family 14 glycosylhydrolase, partial [Bryobacteraceae bacterium]